MNVKTLSLIAGAAMAASTVAGTASTANAAPVVQISFGNLCVYIGPKASTNVVRIKAGWSGYHNVHGTIVIPKRFGMHCGVYRSYGKKFGKTYVLLSSLKTGKLVYARPVGFGPGGAIVVPGYVIRNKALMMGYKNVHALKYHGFTKMWTIRGYKKVGFTWKKFVLRFSRTGVYLGRTMIAGPAVVNGAAIKFKASVMGYKNLHMLQFHHLSQRYTVRGWKKIGFVWRKFVLRFSANGAYLGRTMI